MVGNRGNKTLRSGRPSLVDEQQVEKLLSHARRFVLQELEAENLSLEVRFEASLRLVIKSIPQAVSGEINQKQFLEIVHKIEGLDDEGLRSVIAIGRGSLISEKAA